LKIVSGGQTGVDRAALDAALEAGLPCGGFVPRGRLAEDGPIPARYPLTECESEDYAVRTGLNVLGSDATLILYEGELSGGTLLTAGLCRRHGKPVFTLALGREPPEAAAERCRAFIRRARPSILNVAGPRESGSPGVYGRSLAVLKRVFAGSPDGKAP